jgi:hypothetical protein
MMSFILRMIQRIGGWIGSSSVAGAATEVAKFAAWKLILAGFWFIGVYILCNNLLVFILQFFESSMSGVFGNDPIGGVSMAMQLTGLGAYLAQKLMLVESFAAMIAGLSLAFVRSFLPFPLGR